MFDRRTPEQKARSLSAQEQLEMLNALEPHIKPFIDLAYWADKFLARTSNKSREATEMRKALAQIKLKGNQIRERVRRERADEHQAPEQN